MFDFLRFLKKQPPFEPPTQKQRRYATRLGINVTESMSKADISAEIAEAERRNPKALEQRHRIKEKVREAKFGKELMDLETQWNDFAHEIGFMLAVYTYRKERIVDILRVNGASITEKGKLKLEVEAPKLESDKHIGQYLEWNRYFELPIESLLHHEALHENFDQEEIDAYRKIVEKGLKIARKL